MLYVFLTALIVGVFGGVFLLALTNDEVHDSDLTDEEVIAATVSASSDVNLNQ